MGCVDGRHGPTERINDVGPDYAIEFTYKDCHYIWFRYYGGEMGSGGVVHDPKCPGEHRQQ